MSRFDPLTGLKRCPHCGRELYLSAFNRSRAMPDGYQGWCRRCMRAAHERWWLAHLEAYVAYNARRRAAYARVLEHDRERPCSRCGRAFVVPAGEKHWTCASCQREARRGVNARYRERHGDVPRAAAGDPA